MAEPFVGEICCFGFNFAPRGWAKCDGQLLSISQNDALFSIIGTIYGGNGTTDFALPDLQGRVAMHWGSSPGFDTKIGEAQGTSTVTLTTNQMPQHTHTITAVSIPSDGADERKAVATSTAFIAASRPPNRPWQKPAEAISSAFSTKAISVAGGSRPHQNMQPFLVLNFCIALIGIYPTRS